MRKSSRSKEKIIFKGRKFSIISSEKILSTGEKKTLEYCSRLPTVIVLPVIDRNKIILLREYREERKGIIWGLVSGHVEAHEIKNPKKAARRELAEEIGYTARHLKLLWVSEPSSSIRWKRYVFIATGIRPLTPHLKLKQDIDEKINARIISISEARKLAKDGLIKNETAALTLLRFNIPTK